MPPRMLAAVVLRPADGCGTSRSTGWLTVRRRCLQEARRGGLPAADGRSASPCRADSPLIASRMQPARRSGGTQSAD